MVKKENKREKEAIFIDFDGTLYDREKNGISIKNIETIKKARESGIEIYLCTGRSMASLKQLGATEKLKLDGWICVNGQEIYDEDLNILYSKIMNKEDTKNIIDYMQEHGKMAVIASTDKGFVLDNTNIYSYDSEKSLIELNEKYNTNWIKDDIDNHKVFNYSIIIDTEKITDAGLEEIEKMLNEEDDRYKVTRSHKHYFDITLKDCTKASAIEYVKNLKDITFTYGIGDAPNDHEMLKAVDIPVAMGNADNMTKEMCKFVTESVEKSGVGVFIDRMLERKIKKEIEPEVDLLSR